MNRIFVFIFEGMTDYEITFITHLLNTSGNKEIVTFAYEKRSVKGRSGIEILPSKSISEVNSSEAQGLIIPGGWYGDFRPQLMELIEGFNEQGKLLAGICGAGTVALAKAGVPEGAKYTTPAVKWTRNHERIFGKVDPFPRCNYVNERVVRDNNIITAVGPAFIDFAVEICHWFNLFENEEEKSSFLKEFTGASY